MGNFGEFEGIGQEVLGPDVADFVFKSYTVTKDSEFNKTKIAVDTTRKAAIHPSDKESLQIQNIDWSKEYLDVFVLGSGVELNNTVIYSGNEYKIISRGNFSPWGFQSFVAEEIK